MFFLLLPQVRGSLIYAAVAGLIAAALVVTIIVLLSKLTSNEKYTPHHSGGPHHAGMPPHTSFTPYTSHNAGAGAPHPQSTFFNKSHWRGRRWVGPGPYHYYSWANSYDWPSGTDIDTLYWDGDKYALCSDCPNPAVCPTCPRSRWWFWGW